VKQLSNRWSQKKARKTCAISMADSKYYNGTVKVYYFGFSPSFYISKKKERVKYGIMHG
jgi:hypothetical protein